MQHDDTTIATSNCDIENNKRQIEKEGMFFFIILWLRISDVEKILEKLRLLKIFSPLVFYYRILECNFERFCQSMLSQIYFWRWTPSRLKVEADLISYVSLTHDSSNKRSKQIFSTICCVILYPCQTRQECRNLIYGNQPFQKWFCFVIWRWQT